MQWGRSPSFNLLLLLGYAASTSVAFVHHHYQHHHQLSGVPVVTRSRYAGLERQSLSKSNVRLSTWSRFMPREQNRIQAELDEGNTNRRRSIGVGLSRWWRTRRNRKLTTLFSSLSFPQMKDESSSILHQAFQDSSSRPFQIFTLFLQSSLALSIAAYFLFPSLHTSIDQALSSFYIHRLLPSGLLNWPMLEAVWAVGAFLISSFFYEGFNRLGFRRIDGTKDRLSKSTYWWWAGMNIWMYLGGVYTLILLATPRLPPLQAPSFARLLGETALGVFLYDLCFYPIHLWMHKTRVKRVRDIHAVHHDGYQEARLSSVSTVTQHGLDAAAQVGINIMIQNLAISGVKKHPLSRLLHNFLVPYLLIEAHSGFDLPWMSHRLFPKIMGGPIRHEQHHHEGGRYYHQFFTYLDDLALKKGWWR